MSYGEPIFISLQLLGQNRFLRRVGIVLTKPLPEGLGKGMTESRWNVLVGGTAIHVISPGFL